MRLLVLVTLLLAVAHVRGDTCELFDLKVGNGAALSVPFEQSHMDYFCSCLYSTDWTTVTASPGTKGTKKQKYMIQCGVCRVTHSPLLYVFCDVYLITVEAGAGMQLHFNNNLVTPFYAFVESPHLSLNVGSNTIVITVTCRDCSKDYTITCDRQPPSGGQVQGDPQFTGLRGQSFQVHGIDGEVYNIVSSPSLQVNAKFQFLNSGACPLIHGQKATGCWTHPGQYLGEIGILTRSGERIHLVPGPAASGFRMVTINDKELRDGQVVAFQGGFVSLNGTHVATIQTPAFELVFESSDNFVNQRVSVRDWGNVIGSHGLLGQTYQDKVYDGKIKYIQGSVDSYRVEDGLFGTQFEYNRFNKQ